MNLLLVAVVLALLLGFGFGGLFAKAVKSARTWGKLPVFLVRPGTNNITLEWRRPIGTGFDVEDPQNPVRVPWAAEFLHTFDNKRAYVVNRLTGSPVRLDPDTGAWSGIDGRSWFLRNRDTRIAQIQRSGANNLETLVKYALVGLVIIGIMVIIALAMLGKLA